MASSTADSSQTTEKSYTMLDKGDVEAIGSQCQYRYCRQLDFLPFKCMSCKGKYCLDHRTETSHECPKAGLWAAERRAQKDATATSTTKSATLASPAEPPKACAHPQCKTLINTPLSTGVNCSTCRRDYCLKHRLAEAHACSTLTPLGPITTNTTSPLQTERAKLAISRLKAWGASKQSSILSSTKSKARPDSNASLLQLKRNAKGEASLPPNQRIYLHVEASADTTTAKFPTGDFYYSTVWSVGRVLDAAAKALQVQNVNNRGGGEAERLRVFHVEAGRLLEFSEKIGEATVSGNTIVLLRGVGPSSS